eukprot:UN33275
MENLTIDLLEDIKDRHAPALLVILPNNLIDIDPSILEEWKEVEQNLLKTELKMAVWFAFDCPEIDNIFDVLDSDDDRYHLSGRATSEQVGRVTLSNLFASIRGFGKQNSDRLKNILLVANYDSYAAVPTLAHGANDNGSGVTVLLQLASIFNRLYSNQSTIGPYNILFLLTAAGRFNFQGTRQFMDNIDYSIVENIDFVLCLDRLGVGENLYLHTPKVDGSASTQRLLKTFENIADASDVPLKVKRSSNRGSSSSGINEWQHELLSRKLFAATISASPEANILHSRSSMFDQPELVSIPTLIRNTKYIAEVLCRYIYGHENLTELDVLAGEFKVNEKFIEHWMDYFSRTPRMSPYMNK